MRQLFPKKNQRYVKYKKFCDFLSKILIFTKAKRITLNDWYT